MIVALGLPLAITLQRRAASDIERLALAQAQGIATSIGEEIIREPDTLRAIVEESAPLVGVDGRVVVIGNRGILLADSDGPDELETDFRSPGRPEIAAALNGELFSEIRDSEDLGHDIVATAVPIVDDGQQFGVVRITQNIQRVNDNVRNITIGLLSIGVAALVAGLLLAYGLAGSLARPLSRLAAAAKRLGSGDLTARAENVGGATEVEELGRSFDEMADRLERTVRAQREFVANASHQLRTPLTGMKLRLESALAEAKDDDVGRHLAAADREVDRLSEIVDRLLAMSREIEEGEPTHVDLADAVARALARWEERARNLDTTLHSSGEGGVAQGNPSDLDQILDNLLDNAISYAPGDITVESGRGDGRVFVAVRDRGPGIPEQDLSRVTERFFRGSSAPTGGSGLGLAIARDLAEKWGGSLAVTSAAGEGTRVEVRLRSAE
jgi:signal transduction histidine kinase